MKRITSVAGMATVAASAEALVSAIRKDTVRNIVIAGSLAAAFWNTFSTTAVLAASDDGVAVDKAPYDNRQLLPDFTAAACPDNPRDLVQIKGSLYRHTTGPGLAVHSGLVLITNEGALVIDPAMTCTAGWLRDEIKRRFNVPVAYVVYTHAHADHISGGQVFQRDGAVVVANQRAFEPIVGEKIPTAIPNEVFDEDMTITMGMDNPKRSTIWIAMRALSSAEADKRLLGPLSNKAEIQSRNQSEDAFPSITAMQSLMRYLVVMVWRYFQPG
jgi:hypothetical protein